jgi:AraC-like DNA-binding protein
MRDPIPVYLHLRRAKDLIDRDYARELDVPALARQSHASEAHFSRGFKKAFGETPHQYLLRRRIERAKELFRGTGLSVTEVSLEVGFRSLGSFSSAFRELVGESPSDYARRWRAAGAPPIPACFTLMWTRPHRAVLEKRGTGAAPGGLGENKLCAAGAALDRHEAASSVAPISALI